MKLLILLFLLTALASAPAAKAQVFENSPGQPEEVVEKAIPEAHEAYLEALLNKPPEELHRDELLFLLFHQQHKQAQEQQQIARRLRGIQRSVTVIAGGMVLTGMAVILISSS